MWQGITYDFTAAGNCGYFESQAVPRQKLPKYIEMQIWYTGKSFERETDTNEHEEMMMGYEWGVEYHPEVAVENSGTKCTALVEYGRYPGRYRRTADDKLYYALLGYFTYIYIYILSARSHFSISFGKDSSLSSKSVGWDGIAGFVASDEEMRSELVIIESGVLDAQREIGFSEAEKQTLRFREVEEAGARRSQAGSRSLKQST